MESRIIQMTERVGSVGYNKHGSKMVVIEYNDSHDIWVKFEQGKPVHTSWRHFTLGAVKYPFDRIIFDKGYMGEGKYKTNINNIECHQYKTWYSMLRRCYGKDKAPTYKNVTVDEEWLNYQNFATWYDQNYYEIDGETTELDKDILFKGNKLYSPQTCVFVPHTINYIFVKRDASRGEFPIGVTYLKDKNKFAAKLNNTINGKRKTLNLGFFETELEAFQAYKNAKEELIKQKAEDYKEKIPENLYKAMINYEVEIDD